MKQADTPERRERQTPTWTASPYRLGEAELPPWERRQTGGKTMKKYRMDLTMFDGEGGGAGAGTGAGSTAGAGGTGTGTDGGTGAGTGTEGGRDFDAEFDTMIKGEFKGSFDKKVQNIVKDRLKGSKQTESRLKETETLLSLVGERYGWDGKDLSALRASLESDKAYLEQEALDRGMTVEQLAEVKRLERENRELLRQQMEAQERAAFDRKLNGWVQEAEALKGTYPNLNLMEEFNNQQFVRLLDAGVGVETAYQSVHFNELMGGAMQYTAQQTQKAVMDGVKANGMRPNENGAKGSNGANQKIDVHKLTAAERKALIEEARRNPEKQINFL